MIFVVSELSPSWKALVPKDRTIGRQANKTIKGALTRSSYEERYRLLMDIYRFSPHIKLIRLLRKYEECIQVLEGHDPQIEGLVFKAWKTKGWDDTGIVRCLRKGYRGIR